MTITSSQIDLREENNRYLIMNITRVEKQMCNKLCNKLIALLK